MKNKLTYVLISTIIVGSILLNSCSKQNNTQIEPTSKVEKDLADVQMAEQIEQFRSEILSSKKSGETMYFGEALFLLEASFNYFHSFTSENFVLTKTDSLFIPVEYNLLTVLSFDKIEAVYKEINNTLYYNFENFEAENKQCVLFDFELEATPDGNQLVLVQTMGVINTLKSTNAGIDPFCCDDYWHVGLSSIDVYLGYTRPGRCGAYDGQLIGHDHTTRLEWSAKAFYYSHKAASKKSVNAGNVYYTDVVTHSIFYHGNLYEGNDTYCIPPAEMNQYHHIICEVIEDAEQWYAPEKIFTGVCDIENLLYVSSEKFTSSYLVTTLLTASFGVKHTSPIGPGELKLMPSILLK
jgi:hypothetical protein